MWALTTAINACCSELKREDAEALGGRLVADSLAVEWPVRKRHLERVRQEVACAAKATFSPGACRMSGAFHTGVPRCAWSAKAKTAVRLRATRSEPARKRESWRVVRA